MKIYLINLERSADRLERMHTECASMGIAFERVAAVDGAMLSDAEIAALSAVDRHWSNLLTKTEIGCFLSHRKCFEMIAAGEDEYVAVFEDDVEFSSAAKQLLSSTEWIPGDSDIVKLETQRKKVLLDAPVEGPLKDHTISRLRSQHILTGGYIISRQCAQKLLQKMTKVTAPIDHFLFNPDYGPFDEIKIYQVSPAICIQADLMSTLSEDRSKVYAQPRKPAKILRELKRLFHRSKVGLWGNYINLFTRQQWKRIPFIK